MKPPVCIVTASLTWLVLVVGGRAEEKPVEIRVVDSKTGEPVHRFRYSYEIISPDKHGYPAKRIDVPAENDRGLAVIPAPRRLSLSILVASPDYLPRTPKGGRRHSVFKVFPEDKKRRFEIQLDPGEKIWGVVLDAKDGKPIADAEVAPLDRVNSGWGDDHDTPNWARRARTDDAGRFCVGGDKTPGVAARRKGYWSRPDSYQEAPAKPETRKTPDGKTEIVIRLPRCSDPQWEDWRKDEDRSNHQPTGEKLFRGVVTLADYSHAEGTCTVIVAAARGKHCYWDAALPWSHDPPETKDHVRLDGIPLRKEWSASIATYSNDEAYYVAALREGFSPTVVRIPTNNDNRPQPFPADTEAAPKPGQLFDLQLKRGVRVSGRVEGPGVAEGTAVATLFPEPYLYDWQFANELQWLTRTAKVARDGSFRFEQVEPGLFRLQVLSRKAGPFQGMVIVGREDKQLGPCNIQPFGRIAGVIHDLPGMVYTNVSDSPAGPRIMAPASWGKPIIFNETLGLELFGPDKFVTDEKGRFVIERAPAGKTFVGFSYNLSNDCRDYASEEIVVVPGQTSQVALALPPGQTKGLVSVPLDVVIGDGSFDAFRAAWGRRDRPKDAEGSRDSWFHDVYDKLEIECRLSPVDPSPREPKGRNQWGARIEKGAQRVLLADAAPGDYRLEVRNYRARAGAGPLFQQTIRIEPGNRSQPIRVPLPASSFDVELKPAKNEVLAQVLYAVFRDGRASSFREGFFSRAYVRKQEPRIAVHLMPPGKYEMLVWQDSYGWARSGPIEVRQGAIGNAGVLTFQPGAKLTGRVFFDQELRIPSHVMLVDQTGLKRYAQIGWKIDSFAFEQESLWPGRWTAKVMDDHEEVLVEQSFEVLGREPVELQMKGK
ncbi:MAG: hypothetical protein HQ581_02255 [Planctomycetes bacterium]|nr:hypothetical protein [Planctomycetota bacterium]